MWEFFEDEIALANDNEDFSNEKAGLLGKDKLQKRWMIFEILLPDSGSKIDSEFTDSSKKRVLSSDIRKMALAINLVTFFLSAYWSRFL